MKYSNINTYTYTVLTVCICFMTCTHFSDCETRNKILTSTFPVNSYYDPNTFIEPRKAISFHTRLSSTNSCNKKNDKPQCSTNTQQITTVSNQSGLAHRQPLASITNHHIPVSNKHPSSNLSTGIPDAKLKPLLSKGKENSTKFNGTGSSTSTIVKTQYSSRSTSQKCPHCEKSYKHACSLSKHIKQVHTEVHIHSGNIQCNQCDHR